MSFQLRKAVGPPSDVYNTQMGCVKKRLGADTRRGVCDASRSVDEARREIVHWFGNVEYGAEL